MIYKSISYLQYYCYCFTVSDTYNIAHLKVFAGYFFEGILCEQNYCTRVYADISLECASEILNPLNVKKNIYLLFFYATKQTPHCDFTLSRYCIIAFASNVEL